MSAVETRHVTRDSLFLFAELVVEGEAGTVKVKVRNLSTGGMMAEGGGLVVARGDRLVVNLRNVGDVKGSVAWVQGTRFGVAFDEEIDPKLARAPASTGNDETLLRHTVKAKGPAHPDGDSRLRIL